jgi:hypothetical protein
MELPVACTLTEGKMRERRRTILDAYRFEPTSEMLSQLARLVDLERQCCAFLTFRTTVAAGKPICLEITAPPEPKAAIADFFGSSEFSPTAAMAVRPEPGSASLPKPCDAHTVSMRKWLGKIL